MSSRWPDDEYEMSGHCRLLPSRLCPPDGCFELPCARLEIDESEAPKRWPHLNTSPPTREEILGQIAQLKQRIVELRVKLEALGESQSNGPLDA